MTFVFEGLKSHIQIDNDFIALHDVILRKNKCLYLVYSSETITTNNNSRRIVRTITSM